MTSRRRSPGQPRAADAARPGADEYLAVHQGIRHAGRQVRVAAPSGGGIRPGTTFGETDEYCYNSVRDPVHVHDLHATLLHCLGIDHTRLTYKFQGRHYRLTDVHGNVVKELVA